MRVITTAAEMRPFDAGAFVPTMGALHRGHASLIRQAAEQAHQCRGGRGGPVVVSIFVNPTQFNDPGDLERYPRTPEADERICDESGCDVLFAPSVSEVYPPGFNPPAAPLPPVATTPGLEDAHRPGHFAGVCGVVARLFGIVRPEIAVFGEKDWQQLAVIRAMVRAQGSAVRIVPGPTVREPDGLAMSSRNRFLSPEDRRRALSISAALRQGAAAPDWMQAERVMRRTLDESGLQTEYAVVRDEATLMPAPPGARSGLRALIAARCGPVRLIDNAPWPG